MTPQQFIVKWKQANLTERSAAQQRILDLCELLDQPKPAQADPEEVHYTFERGAHKTDGGEGWARDLRIKTGILAAPARRGASVFRGCSRPNRTQ